MAICLKQATCVLVQDNIFVVNIIIEYSHNIKVQFCQLKKKSRVHFHSEGQ